MVTCLVGQGANQDLPQPGNQLRLVTTGKSSELAMCLEEGFLHQVGGVELQAQGVVEHRPRYQPEIVAVKLEELPQGRGIPGAGLGHQPVGDRVSL